MMCSLTLQFGIKMQFSEKAFTESFEIVLTRRNACVILVLAFFGELAEWFKAPVLKTGVSERNRGFESHILRFGIFEDTQQHTDKCPIVQKTAVGASHHGEVPKRLKGHPWKGCRPLIAVRGFKSLLLRQKSIADAVLFFVHFPKGGECADCEQRTENAKIPSFRHEFAKNHDTFRGEEEKRKWNCSRGFVSYIM